MVWNIGSCTKPHSKIYSTSNIWSLLLFESLNKAPSSFIQYKAIEILLQLQNIGHESFSIGEPIELDFKQHIQKLDENNSTIDLANFKKF